jgi:hypothetical protein
MPDDPTTACTPACGEQHTYQPGCDQRIPGGWVDLLGSPSHEPDDTTLADLIARCPEHGNATETWPECRCEAARKTAVWLADNPPEPAPAALPPVRTGDPAYDAVYAYIRALGDYLPPDPVHRNAIIWRAVEAAAGARTTPDNPPTSSNGPDNAQLQARLSRVLDECRVLIPNVQAAAVLAELAPELTELLDYRNRITWETTCGGCARTLDSAYAETVRAEEAERQLAAAETRAAAVTRVQREIARLGQLPTVTDDDGRADSFATGARWAIRQIHNALTGQDTP